jgi:signal transduction histidine kinase
MMDAVNILLVDDEPRNLDALEALLDGMGNTLLRASDADEALKTLLEHDVAAIILDIKMPGTSGFELAKIIKGTRRFREIPILFLTAYLVDDRDVITGYGAGAVDYLTKPVNPEIVRHKVSVYADLFRKTRLLEELNGRLEARVHERTAELEKSEAALRAADRKKDEFIAVLAHELRNPLAPLRFGLDLLSETVLQNQPVVSKTLSTMSRQLDHMVRLIDDLLDMSRISRGAIELKKQCCDLAEVVEVVLENHRTLLERRNQSLSKELAESVFVNGDPTRLAQIIGNLLHNAIKFTPQGGQIRIRLDREGDLAVVTVTDSGEGFEPDDVERMFEMFARVTQPGSDSERGLGIGLALARQLTALHNGTLTAASAGPGCGASFAFSIPVVNALPTPRGVEQAVPAVSGGRSLNVVVIEDSEDIVFMLTTLLERLGHRVDVARSGEAGVTLVNSRKPEVVLCDLGLPGIDGAEACRLIRRLDLEMQPVMIALTGWGREADLRRTQEAGFDDHLVKPVTAERLKGVLHKAALESFEHKRAG